MSKENEKQKLYIWPIFTWINRTFDTGHPINANWLSLRDVRSRNSVYFVVRFPLSDERTWVTWHENSICVDNESFTAQPSHISRDYTNHTQDIIYALCDIEPSCLHYLNGHYPYNSIYPHQRWDGSNYSYPSLIRREAVGVGWGGVRVGGGAMFAVTPQITGSLLQWSNCLMNKKI